MTPDATYTIMEPYMTFIRMGIKGAEGRISSRGYDKLRLGQTVYFHNRHDGILCEITYLNRYGDFQEMLEKEGVGTMLPQFDPAKRAILTNNGKQHLLRRFKWNPSWTLAERVAQGVSIYKGFPRSERVYKMGALAIGVKYLYDYFKGEPRGRRGGRFS